MEPVGRNREDAARSKRADQDDRGVGGPAPARASARAHAGERGASTPARIAVVLAAAIAIVAAAALIFSDDEGHDYTLLFQTGGQLVPGNQVLVAGQVVGTVDSIDLTEDNQAAVNVTTDEPLREGTTAVIRSTSLSGVANRYVSLTLGPNNAAELPDGETITGADTTAPVDLDQLFNVFKKKQRTSLRKFIDGNATAYSGEEQAANRAYKFLNPALSTSERLFAELSKDSVALQRFLVSGSQTFGALAQQRSDLTNLISNTNRTMQAISERNTDLDVALTNLPDTLRQANTSFVNLRATLDDLDPLVAASKPATKNLEPFLRRLRLVAGESVPVFGGLANIVRRPGEPNDLRDTLELLPQVREQGSTALPASIRAMDDSQEEIGELRAYSPDLMNWLRTFGQFSATFDANGHYARVQPAASNVFDYAGGTLIPQYTNGGAQFGPIDTGVTQRCPGNAAPQLSDGSNPFLDGGTIDFCEPTDQPPEAP